MYIDDFFIHQVRLKKLPKLIISYYKSIENTSSFNSMISFTDYLDVFKFPNSLKLKKNVEHIMQDSLLPSE